LSHDRLLFFFSKWSDGFFFFFRISRFNSQGKISRLGFRRDFVPFPHSLVSKHPLTDLPLGMRMYFSDAGEVILSFF